MIMKARLNMLDVKANFRGKYSDSICDLCQREEDTTEHIFDCKRLIRIKSIVGQISILCLSEPNKKSCEYIKQAMLIKSCVRLDSVGLVSESNALP